MALAGGEYRLGTANPVLMIEFSVTSWCNYTCAYCVTTVQRRRPESFHSFDRHDVSAWIRAFERVPFEFSMLCRGGEPFLDHENFSRFLAAVGALPKLHYARVDTNGTWAPERYDAVPLDVRRKVQLNISFHPTQIEFEPFVKRIERIAEAGWAIGMINYVLEAKQKFDYERVRDYFDEHHGIYVNPAPDGFDQELVGPPQIRRKAQNQLLPLLPEVDIALKTGTPTTGRSCFYPTIAYYVAPDGWAERSCAFKVADEPRKLDFIHCSDQLRPLPAAVKCPQMTCLCLDRYAFLEEIPTRGRSLDLLGEYVTDVRALQASARAAKTPA